MVYLYAEINLIVIFILSFVLYKVKLNVDQQISNILFGRVLIATMFMCLAEALISFMEGGSTSKIYLAVFNLVLALRYVLTAFLSFCWLAFICMDNESCKKIMFKKSVHAICVLPGAVLCICAVLSPWTHWIFAVDSSTCTLARGSLYFINTIVTWIYFTSASVAALVFFLMDKSHKNPVTQLCVVFLPLLGGITQFLMPELPSIWPLISILLVMKFIDFQEQQIFIDGLTGLNNRRSFDKYLSTVLNERDVKNLTLYMIDVDHFKFINDNYGHLEGDNALVKTAEILRNACNGKNAFLARFGGDEFAIVYQRGKTETPEIFRNEIMKSFVSYNEKKGRSENYSIRISIGYASAIHGRSERNSVQLIRSADKALYENKHTHQLQA